MRMVLREVYVEIWSLITNLMSKFNRQFSVQNQNVMLIQYNFFNLNYPINFD